MDLVQPFVNCTMLVGSLLLKWKLTDYLLYDILKGLPQSLNPSPLSLPPSLLPSIPPHSIPPFLPPSLPSSSSWPSSGL